MKSRDENKHMVLGGGLCLEGPGSLHEEENLKGIYTPMKQEQNATFYRKERSENTKEPLEIKIQ